MSDKFDLFPSLGKLGRNRSYQWFLDLPEQERKAVQPFVIMRWLTGTSTDEEQILRINRMCNPYMFSLGQDKELMIRLLAKACTGKNGRFQWIKGPSTGGREKLSVGVIAEYYEITPREAVSYLPVTKPDTIVEMAEHLGYDKDAMTKLKKELQDGSGSPKTGSTSKKNRTNK